MVLWTPPQVKGHAREGLGRPLLDGKLWPMQKAEMVDAARMDTGGKGRWNRDEADAYLVAALGGRFWTLYEGDIGEADLKDVGHRYFTKVHAYIRGKRAGQTVRTGVIHRVADRFFLWS